MFELDDKHCLYYRITWQRKDRSKQDETYTHLYKSEQDAKEHMKALEQYGAYENFKMWQVTEHRRRIG